MTWWGDIGKVYFLLTTLGCPYRKGQLAKYYEVDIRGKFLRFSRRDVATHWAEMEEALWAIRTGIGL